MEARDSKGLEGLARVPVRLVFDTAESPLAEGVRRRDVTSRHLLYEAEELCLDLRLERDPRGPRSVLVGQLLDRQSPADPLSAVPVLLLTEGEVVERVETNRLGEFQLEIEPRKSMSLCLAVRGEHLVEVPLDRRMTKRLEEEEEASA